MSFASRPWAGRTHVELAELARELLLCGHLIDRSGMPQAIARLDRDGMAEVAIGEWMGASPIYTKRMQRLLGFEGETVETAFKGMQLDIGAPPEFLDFRYTVSDDKNGSFCLAHCGALMDVEPMGEDYVHTMCHTIEDPTFDATAVASNPRAQVRPVHRPPREPADREPHCEWTVTIDDNADPVPMPAQAVAMSRSNAAQLDLSDGDPSLDSSDGWNNYSEPLDPDLVMERFSSQALSRICDEVALQGQMLSRSFFTEITERVEPDEVLPIATKQAIGIAGLASKRLAAALQADRSIAGLAKVLAVHPMFLPRSYVDFDIAENDSSLRVAIRPCPGTAEVDGLSWPALLTGPTGTEIVRSAVICHLRTALVSPSPTTGDELVSWTLHDDPSGAPQAQAEEVTLAEFSTGAKFAFERRTIAPVP